MLFFKRCFVRLGSILHIFLDHRKSQESSKNLKKTQKKKSQNLSNLLEKTKNKKKTNKLTQPYNNFAEASGRIAAQLSAVIIFPCVAKC